MKSGMHSAVIALTTLFTLSNPALCRADVILDITGLVGGTTFDWIFSSTSIVTNATYTDASASNYTAGLPFPDDDNDNVIPISGLSRSGDVIVNTELQDLSSTGDFVFQINGGADQVGAFAVDVESTGGGRIDFDPGANITVPSSPGINTYTYSGSGTTTLTSGTFDSVFNDGTAVFTAAPNGSGGNNTITINVTTLAATVPEPAVGVMAGLIAVAAFFRRRRVTAVKQSC